LGLLYLKQSAAIKQNEDEMKDIGRATQWLEKAYELSPNNIKSLQALQLAYSKANNKEQLDKINNKLKQLTN